MSHIINYGNVYDGYYTRVYYYGHLIFDVSAPRSNKRPWIRPLWNGTDRRGRYFGLDWKDTLNIRLVHSRFNYRWVINSRFRFYNYAWTTTLSAWTCVNRVLCLVSVIMFSVFIKYIVLWAYFWIDVNWLFSMLNCTLQRRHPWIGINYQILLVC